MCDIMMQYIHHLHCMRFLLHKNYVFWIQMYDSRKAYVYFRFNNILYATITVKKRRKREVLYGSKRVRNDRYSVLEIRYLTSSARLQTRSALSRRNPVSDLSANYN